MKKRIISLFLCVAMLVGIIPFGGGTVVSTDTKTDEFVNYGAKIGSTACFNTGASINFLVFADPSQFDYDVDWDNDDNWVYYDESNNHYDIEATQEFVIENYYYDSETTALWYRLGAAPGYQLPEKMSNSTWVFQNFTEEYQYEGWEEYSPDALLINRAKNFVFDSEGNAVTSVLMSAYDEVDLMCDTSLQGKVDYQWQIYIENEWVDIDGENQSAITVTAGILLNAFEDELNADIRCITRTGSKTVVGESIRITMEPYSPAEMYSLRSASSNALSAVAEEEDEYRYVTVKYLFQNGAEAANPFVAKVLKNEAISVTVDFPTVQGYLPYYQDVQQNSLTIDEPESAENVTHTVYYLPTDVEYRIDVYFQNVEDDNYTFYSTETLSGLTGSKVPHTTVNYEGMYELLHETPTIAANGSTRIEVYFNRVYYLTHFELDGGYGVYSIYARYGSKLSDNVGTPIRPGYTFVGWDDITSGSGDGIADVMPDTVPAKEQSFRAIWKENPTAEVRIAFWGENPNDEGYSYIESQTLEVKPGTVLTYGDSGYICGLQEHTHGTDCTYLCGLTPHTHDQNCYTLNCDKYHEHSDGCYICGEEGHTHGTGCYDGVGSKQNVYTGVPSNPTDGLIHEHWIYGNLIYINGSWYRYSGATQAGENAEMTCHVHTDACLGCGKTEHTHTDYTGSCYTLTCQKTVHTHDHTCTSCIQHQHSDACVINPFDSYDASKWTFVKSDTVTVEADGTTVMNVYFNRTYKTLTFRRNGNRNGEIFGTIYKKWGSTVIDEFNEIGERAGTNSWCTDYEAEGSRTNYIRIMPAEDRTYYSYYESGTERVATYYGQKLDGTGYEILMEVKITRRNNTNVTEEDFAEFEGYTLNESLSTKKGSSFGGATFYYDRSEFSLEFYSGTTCVRTEYPQYEESFAQFSGYTPKFPTEYEQGSRRFVGWYLNPECTGDMVDLSKMTMPAENMALYAKWELVTHQVNIYKEKHDDGTFGDPVLPDGQQPDPVLHGHKVFETDFTLPIPENKPYSFVGWFYMDGDTEQMWDFEHSVVVKDTDIYAKWSAEVLVPYTVRYVVQNGDGSVTQIAESNSSSALAGTTVTFTAKGGMELYDGYQTGYFPLTTSHSLTMDVTKSETGMFYDFVYVAKDKVPYTVRYVDENGTDLIDPKIVENNSYAIVTEKFVYIPDYSPDKYQKTLVLNGEDGAVNEIVFYYKKDTTQSVYNVTHYIRSTDGVNYIEHTSYGDIGTIGDALRVSPLELKGFTFDYATVNGVSTELTNGSVNGTIVKEGLEIKLYYERNKYPYKIQYLDKDTLAVLKTADVITPGEYYGSVVTATTPPTIANYSLSSVSSCVITEDNGTNPTKNIIIVYYSEQTVRINYEVVGPNGCGSVNPLYTDVKVLSGTGASSTATASEDYRFVGWYSDRDCTQQVTSNASLFLTIPSDKVWRSATYYAKFEPHVSDLTIVRTNASDSSQVYVYEVKNNATGETLYATIVGNGQVTIKNLLMGEYTVTQQNDWSWRHDDSAQSINHQSVDGTLVTFGGSFTTDQWLNGNSQREKNQRRQSE